MPNEQAKNADLEEPPVNPEEEPRQAGTAAAAGQSMPEAASPGEFTADETEQLRERIGTLERQAGEARDRALRAQAELENLRKRTARDVESAHRYALERFVGDLLPVLDGIELGLGAAGATGDVGSLQQGMELTRKMFLDTLARFGVTPIDPVGEKFNPERHQAVSVQQIEGTEAGTVVAVMQKGYELNGRLVRPAMVVVAR